MSRRTSLQPGTIGFTAVLAASMGVTALAIDSMLPAFDALREDLGLAPDSTDVALLVTSFVIGLGVGQLPAGLLADRFGRRPVLWGGLGIYLLGAIGTAMAPSLATMAVARFVWGLGAAGPRVAALAMVRDSFKGAQMARQMSSIMAIFLLVPMIAPGLGALAISFGPWQLAVWMCVVAALIVFVMSWRLPATMPASERRSLGGRDIVDSWRFVLSAPGTVPYMLGIALATSVFLSYIASSENVIETVFGLGDWFPLVFGVMAIGLAIGSLTNGRIVERVGLDGMLFASTAIFVAASMAMTVIALATDGTPAFALFAPPMLIALMAAQLTMINANSAAMIPLGETAGSGAALLGMMPLVAGSIIGSLIDRQFDGTITPLSIAFACGSVLTFAAIRWADATTPRSSEALLVTRPASET
jgi:DHA1 family bicyclomycin/chloramphenicol resistance-like MFS transporter